MLGLDVLLGGVTGLLGNVITGILKYKNQKMQFEHDQKMIGLETQSMIEKSKAQIAITETQVKGEIEKTDAEAYKEAQKNANVSMFSEKWIDNLFNVEGKVGKFLAVPAGIALSMGFAFVDWLRGVMRPLLTIYLTVMSSIITYMAWKIIQAHGLATMTATEAIGLYSETTSIVIYLTVSCVTWWFGDRTMSKALTEMKMNKIKKDKKE